MKDDKNQNTRFVVCHITGMSEDEYDKLGFKQPRLYPRRGDN